MKLLLWAINCTYAFILSQPDMLQKQSIAFQITKALVYMHSRNPIVIHIDIKHGNILVRPIIIIW